MSLLVAARSGAGAKSVSLAAGEVKGVRGCRGAGSTPKGGLAQREHWLQRSEPSQGADAHRPLPGGRRRAAAGRGVKICPCRARLPRPLLPSPGSAAGLPAPKLPA